MDENVLLAAMPDAGGLALKFDLLARVLDERTRRLVAAAEAEAIGFGGVTVVAQASGLSRGTVIRNNSYMRIEQRHPMVSGFEGTALLPGAESRLPVRQLKAASLVLSVVPEYPSFPPEVVYSRSPHTDEPAALLRELGASRVAYFPRDIDRTFWRSGNTDLSQFLQNAIRWVLGEARQPVVVTGQGLVEVFAWQTEVGYALHILNYNNPNLTQGAVRRFYPLGAQQVSFDVEEGRKIWRVQALRTARRLPFTQQGRTVHFKIPEVTDYEVVALT